MLSKLLKGLKKQKRMALSQHLVKAIKLRVMVAHQHKRLKQPRAKDVTPLMMVISLILMMLLKILVTPILCLTEIISTTFQKGNYLPVN